MRICFPVKENNGLDSTIEVNIIMTKMYLIVDTQDGSLKEVPKTGLNPLAPLEKEMFDVIIVNQIGKVAVKKMHERRKRVFKSYGTSVARNLDMMKRRQLAEITGQEDFLK